MKIKNNRRVIRFGLRVLLGLPFMCGVLFYAKTSVLSTLVILIGLPAIYLLIDRLVPDKRAQRLDE